MLINNIYLFSDSLEGRNPVSLLLTFATAFSLPLIHKGKLPVRRTTEGGFVFASAFAFQSKITDHKSKITNCFYRFPVNPFLTLPFSVSSVPSAFFRGSNLPLHLLLPAPFPAIIAIIASESASPSYGCNIAIMPENCNCRYFYRTLVASQPCRRVAAYCAIPFYMVSDALV